MHDAIRATNAAVRLPNGFIALRPISFTIRPGQIVGLIGPSGAGKTTLLRSLVGQQRLSGGTLAVLGTAVGDPSLRAKVAYMPQSPAVYGDLSVRDNLRYFARMLGCDSTRETERCLDTVELVAQRDQLVMNLSGGQRQRVSLGITLLGSPLLLVLDEPTVGLDPVLRDELWKLFRRLSESGVTLVISSHVMDEASHCDDLLLLRDGDLLAHGTPAALCHETASRSVEAAFIKLVGAAS
jgi:ABC-2 type transport system ATP-binding protein